MSGFTFANPSIASGSAPTFSSGASTTNTQSISFPTFGSASTASVPPTFGFSAGGAMAASTASNPNIGGLNVNALSAPTFSFANSNPIATTATHNTASIAAPTTTTFSFGSNTVATTTTAGDTSSTQAPVLFGFASSSQSDMKKTDIQTASTSAGTGNSTSSSTIPSFPSASNTSLFSFPSSTSTNAPSSTNPSASGSASTLFSGGSTSTANNTSATTSLVSAPTFSFGGSSGVAERKDGVATPSTNNPSASGPAPSLFGGATTTSNTTPSLFGGATTTSTATTGSGPAPVFTFGGATTATAEKKDGALSTLTNSSSSFATPSLFGGSATTSTASTSVPASTFSFGTDSGTLTVTTDKKDGENAPSTKDTSASASTSGFTFGSAVSTTNSSTKDTAPVATPTNQSSPSRSSSSTTTSATQSLVVHPPPPLPYQTQTVEQIINTFSAALEEDALEFLHEAQRVAHYDAILRDSQRSISYLASQVSRLLLRQSELDRNLATIGSYQQTLTTTLDGLEVQIEEMLASQSDLTPEEADVERERAYALAMECNSRLQSTENRVDHIRKDLKDAQERAWKKNEHGDQDVANIVDWMNQQYDMMSELELIAKTLEEDVRVIGSELSG